jgi:hypothetical protein
VIVVAGPAGAGTDDAELELAGELTDADPLAGADVAAAVAAATAELLLLDEDEVAAGAGALDWLAVPCEQAVSNASSAAVPVSRVERVRRFTRCPFWGSASVPAIG